MVLGGVVGDGLEEGLSVVAEGDPAGGQLGLVGRPGAQGAAVVLVLLLIVVVVDLAGLEAPGEDGGLQPFWRGERRRASELAPWATGGTWNLGTLESRKRSLFLCRIKWVFFSPPPPEPTGPFYFPGPQGRASGQVGGVQAPEQSQVPPPVATRGGQTAKD